MCMVGSKKNIGFFFGKMILAKVVIGALIVSSYH